MNELIKNIAPLLGLMLLVYVLSSVLKPTKKKKQKPNTVDALKNWDPPKSEPKYKPVTTLFTAAELTFYKALKTAVGNDFHISGKIRLADVIIPKETQDQSIWQTAFNKVAKKHLDYILCDPQTLSIIAAIELDDKSHNKKTRIQRDQFLNQAMESAGVPLIRFKARASYNTEEIKNRLQF